MRVTALATPGSHLHPPLLRPDRRRQHRDGRARPLRRCVLRRLAAVRRHRAPGPPRRRAHRCAGPSPARLGPPAGRPAPRRGRRLPDPRLRVVLLGHAVRGHRLDHRAGEEGQPGAHPGRGDLRPRAARRARRLARLLRAHGVPPTRPGPPNPTSALRRLADATELRRRIEAGEWVVDLRNRTAFAAGHARGTLNFGLDGAFATYLGWLITWGTPVTLLGETPEAVAEAQRELVRIGIDRPAAHATGSPEDWADGELASFPTATFADLADVRHHRARGGPGRPTHRGVRRRGDQRRRQHPPARAVGPARRGARRRGVGALRSRVPRLGRRLDARRRRGARSWRSTTPSTTPRRSGCTWCGPEAA